METAVAAARQHASSGLTSLSHRLAKQFTAAHGDAARNLAFSPLSIYSALSLVAAGVQGKTLSELLDLLGTGTGSRDGVDANVRAMVEQASPQDGGRPRVSYASGLWHDSTRTLKPAYRDVAAAFLRSVVRAVDFLTKPGEAVTQINNTRHVRSILNGRRTESDQLLTAKSATDALASAGTGDTPTHPILRATQGPVKDPSTAPSALMTGRAGPTSGPASGHKKQSFLASKLHHP